MKYSLFLLCLPAVLTTAAQQADPIPVIPEADGFFVIPQAKMQSDKNRIYKAIYDATKTSKDASQLLPALNMAGSEVNALGVCKIPISHAQFVIVFHGAAIDGIMNNEHYHQKYGIDNPNLKVLKELKAAGVKLYVCGQNLLADKVDLKAVSPDVTIASDALIVLMSFQNDGYALMSF